MEVESGTLKVVGLQKQNIVLTVGANLVFRPLRVTAVVLLAVNLLWNLGETRFALTKFPKIRHRADAEIHRARSHEKVESQNSVTCINACYGHWGGFCVWMPFSGFANRRSLDL